MQIRQKRRKIKKMMIVNLKSMKKGKRKNLIITNQYSTSFGTTGLIKMNQLGTSLKIQKKTL